MKMSLTEYLQKGCEHHDAQLFKAQVIVYNSSTNDVWHDIWIGVRIPVHNSIRENLLGTVKNFLIWENR